MKKDYFSRALASRHTWCLCHNNKTFNAFSNATRKNISNIITDLINEGEFVSLAQVADVIHSFGYKLDLTVNTLDYHEERYIDGPERVEYYYFTNNRGETVYGCTDNIIGCWRDYEVSHDYMVTCALYWQDKETLLIHVERITDVIEKLIKEEIKDVEPYIEEEKYLFDDGSNPFEEGEE